jgi:hypothetical protein
MKTCFTILAGPSRRPPSSPSIPAAHQSRRSFDAIACCPGPYHRRAIGDGVLGHPRRSLNGAAHGGLSKIPLAGLDSSGSAKRFSETLRRWCVVLSGRLVKPYAMDRRTGP